MPPIVVLRHDEVWFDSTMAQMQSASTTIVSFVLVVLAGKIMDNNTLYILVELGKNDMKGNIVVIILERSVGGMRIQLDRCSTEKSNQSNMSFVVLFQI
jgi:hypothetical protein